MSLPSLGATPVGLIKLNKCARSAMQDDVASMSLPSLDHHDLGDIACEPALLAFKLAMCMMA